MDVIEFRPDRDQYAFTFGGVAPVRKVQPGTMLRLWTDDAFCGNLRDPADMPSAKLTMPFVNPQTGPFYVEGAEPGDTLALHFAELQPGAGLRRVQHHPAVRRPDGHGPHRHAAGSAGGADLDLRGGPGPAHRRVPGPGQRPAAGAADGSDAGHGGRGPGRRRGAVLAGPGRLRREHGYPRDARRRQLLPGGQRAGRAVLRRRRPLPAGRGRVVRDGGGGRDGRLAHRGPDQGRRAGLAADRDRRLPHGGGVEPAAGGRLADQPGGHGRLAERPVRAGQARRLPAAHPGERVPAGQRGGRQLQLGHEGAQEPAAPGGRLRGHAPAAARARRW